MARVLLTKAAEEARVEIWLHIAHDNSSAADRLLDQIDNRCRLYAEQPLMGEVRPDLGETLRTFTVGGYVVVYRPVREGIEVVLVIHGARDIPVHMRSLIQRREQ